MPLFGMAPGDYKRFLNLLSTHGCTVDFREFRSGFRPDAGDGPVHAVPDLPRPVPVRAASQRRSPSKTA
jgi:hypothetical protein